MSIANIEGEYRFFHPEGQPAKDLEPISDEEISNLLAAFGNSEAKLATLLAMELGIIYDRSGLHQRVMEVQGEKPGWVMSKKGPFKYCEDSLAPIGLVTEEVIDPSMNTWGYILTRYGGEDGKTLAGLLGKLSLEDRTPLYHYFGPTHSSSRPTTVEEMEYKKRAPLTRLRIYRALTGSATPLRETDLLEYVADVSQEALSQHLLKLKFLGIITYESRSHTGDLTLYQLATYHPKEAPPKYQRYPTLTRDVWDFMVRSQGKSWSRTEVAYQLQHNEKYRKRYEGWQETSLFTVVNSVLSHLRDRGYLEVEKFDGLTQSQASLTEGQRERLTRLVSLIDSFQARDEETWRRGRELARSLAANPEKLALLFAQAREASPSANRQSPEELAGDLLYLVQENPGSTIAELQGLLKQEFVRAPSSRQRIGRAMKSLNDSGRVRREGRPPFRYFINPRRQEKGG